MTNKIVSLPCRTKIAEQMSDINWCKSTFQQYSETMEQNFMNDDVKYAYDLCNMIRIEAKGIDNAVYTEALKVLSIYGDLLYGRDVRIEHWRVQRIINTGYEIVDRTALNRENK